MASSVIAPGDSPPVSDRQFAANAGWLVAGQGVAKIAAFAFVIVITRALDVESYGYFVFAVSFVPLFLVVGSLGLDLVVLKEVAADPSRLAPVFATSLMLRSVLGLAALLLAVAAGSLIVGGEDALVTLALIGAALLCDEITHLYGAVFKAFERVKFHALTLLVNRILAVLLAVAVVARGGGILPVATVYLCSSVAATAVAFLTLRYRFPPVPAGSATIGTGRQLIRAGAPFAMAAALNMALFRSDAVLLQALEGPAAVGQYGVAYRFLDSFLFVAYALTVVAMPRIARLRWSEQSETGFNTVLALMLAFYVPLAIGGAFLSGWIVPLVFGESYAPAAVAVGWLTAAGVFYAVAYLCRYSAAALGQARSIVWVAAAALGVNIAVNLVVIPRYGFQGAAAVTLLCELLEACLLGWVLARAAPLRIYRFVAAPVVAGLGMASALALNGRRDAVGALVAVVVYLLVLAAALLALRNEDTDRIVAGLRR